MFFNLLFSLVLLQVRHSTYIDYIAVTEKGLRKEGKDGKKFTECTTDVKGEFDVKHLVAGSYRMVETEAPAGYIESPNVFAFTVDSDGMTEGVTEYTIDVTDDYTKLHVSKRDITNEAEIEGAKLTLKDSDGKVIDSWTSTTEDHVINALAPGKYTLTEERTPHTYDVAESIDFTVEKTGEIQTAVMYDKPISIKGEIDKRQEIADPTHPYTEANGDGENNADTSTSDDGSYDYTLDFRSTSNTWTDEFTVEDDLYGVMTGKATLDSITTPQAYKDFDGKMNVWYKTDQTPSDYSDESGANQTLSDGHGNPWLTDESNSETLGEDGRKIDYTGWKLWKADVSTTEAEDLKVSDLELAEGEHVTAIRFEYGRVESGFTTREDDWDRDGIKDSHDDVNDATETAKGNGSYSDGVSILVDLDGSGKFTAFGNNGLGGKIKQKDGTYTCKDGDTVYSLTLNKDGSASAKMTDKDGKETKVDLAAGQFKISEGVSGDYAPAIVHLKVTDDYRDGDSFHLTNTKSAKTTIAWNVGVMHNLIRLRAANAGNGLKEFLNLHFTDERIVLTSLKNRSRISFAGLNVLLELFTRFTYLRCLLKRLCTLFRREIRKCHDISFFQLSNCF